MPNGKINLNDIYLKIGQLEGTVKGFDSKLEGICRNCDKEEKRIQMLEHITDQFIGKISILGMIAGFLGSVLIAVVKYFIGNK